MVKRGIIRKVIEPTDWVSNMVVIRRKNNHLRICIDPIHLNRQIQRPHYMLPTQEKILPSLKSVSALEARNGFWQTNKYIYMCVYSHIYSIITT